ncbi:uncharacterized protein RB166_010037 [Leptodactylus fuscus]
MDPHSTGYTWNKNSETVQTQPQWQDTSALSHQSHLYNPRAVVPPGLECLVEVEEVTLQDKAFFISSGQTLFTIRRESECCGPAFNLRLQNSKRRVMVLLRAESGEGCCGGESYLKITVLPATTIGFIKCSNSSSQMNVSIQTKYGEPAFTAELPLSSSKQSTIEILSVKGYCPVATITKEGKKKSSKVIFHFPMDMEATLKTVILAAFLYMKYQLNNLYSSSNHSTSDDGWMAAGGIDFHHGGFDGGHGGGGGDWGGDCGGGDWGGGGGDCGGGGGGDCGGGGGGDCGGGGGDCGGGGGGDCGGGGGGDCGGGGCD